MSWMIPGSSKTEELFCLDLNRFLHDNWRLGSASDRPHLSWRRLLASAMWRARPASGPNPASPTAARNCSSHKLVVQRLPPTFADIKTVPLRPALHHLIIVAKWTPTRRAACAADRRARRSTGIIGRDSSIMSGFAPFGCSVRNPWWQSQVLLWLRRLGEIWGDYIRRMPLDPSS